MKEINGTAGNDVFNSGAGLTANYVTGMAGNDKFVDYRPGSGDYYVGDSSPMVRNEGVDTLVYPSHSRAEVTMVASGGGDFSISLNSDVSPPGSSGKVADTGGVERIEFSDIKLAIDFRVSGSGLEIYSLPAARVAKVLGMVFGKEAVHNAEYAGIGLRALDGGMSYESLIEAAFRFAGATSNQAAVELAVKNILNVTPPAEVTKPYVDVLDSGSMTLGQLGATAADGELNVYNIGLVGVNGGLGLCNVGLAYV